MNASYPNPGERVRGVQFTEDTLAVDLADGRTIMVPSGAGYGIHWPDIDEDLSTEGLLRGAPAAEPVRLRR